MSAQSIYDTAPLESLIRYSDGTKEPPARHTRKLADWKRRNGLPGWCAKPRRRKAAFLFPVQSHCTRGISRPTV